MTTCAKRECNLPVFVEPRTHIAHKYCGRTHALESEGSGRVQPPHGTCQICNLAGCRKTVAFDASTGRVHDFCCREHANEAIRAGRWDRPLRESMPPNTKAGHMCNFPSCRLPVYKDKQGRSHDYCGRTHAVEHRIMQEQVGHSSSSSSSSFSVGGATISGAGLLSSQPSASPSSVFTTGAALTIPPSTKVATASTKVNSQPVLE